MKRAVSVFLIFAICVCLCPVSAFASGSGSNYTDGEAAELLQEYKDLETKLNSLFTKDSAIGYWNMIRGIQKKGFLNNALDWASHIMKEYPDEEKYGEILITLLTIQSSDIASQVQIQSQFDDVKDAGDYAMDVVEMATEFIGGAEIFQTVSPILDVVTDGTEVLIETQEQAKYYEVSIRDYSQSAQFLSAVAEYADNESLRSAAVSLLRANEELLLRRLEYLSDTVGGLAVYEEEFFLKNLSMTMLKNTDTYLSNGIGKKAIDKLGAILEFVQVADSGVKFGYKATMLAGDLGFGTTNTFRRYQEMKAISQIATAIVQANKDVEVSKNGSADSITENIRTKCNYYKMLISAHIRGEYLLHSLLVNDAGILSDLMVLFDRFKDENETMDAWYSRQITCLTEYYEIIDRMIGGGNVWRDTSSPFVQDYWVIFTEGYRGNRVEVSAVDSSLPGGSLSIVWNAENGLYLNDDSGSGEYSRSFLDGNDTWSPIGTYSRFSDKATEILASSLDVYDAEGNLVLEGCSYEEVDWELIHARQASATPLSEYYGCYQAPLEKMISEGVDRERNYGFLYDLDADGIKELVYIGVFKLEDGVPIYGFSVYDIENGQAVAKLDKVKLLTIAGGPDGYVSLANYQGRTVLVSCAENVSYYGTSASAETHYKVYDAKSLTLIASTDLEYTKGSPIRVKRCLINGKSGSYNEYVSMENAIDPIIIADVYGESLSNGSMMDYELLQHIQLLAGVAPEQARMITQADAEKTANSVWKEYLNRQQGIDWRIVEIGTVIKDGVEYYCYALQSNSKSGKDDWKVSQCLFVNSVTGEHTESLYTKS